MRFVPVRASFRAIVASAVLLLAACGNDEPASLRPDETGPDPFRPPASSVEAPPELQPILAQALAAADDAEAEVLADEGSAPDDNGGGATRLRLDARLQAATAVLTDAGYGLIRPRSIVGVTVLPQANTDLCDLDGLVASFTDDRSAAVAFASVHGVRTDDIPTYLDSLTAGYLIDDAEVIAHGFRNDLALPYRTVLATGTAVLVDADGLPRVRCRGGSPLVPAKVELDGRIIGNDAFADSVIAASIASSVPTSSSISVDGRFTDDPRQALGPPNGVAISLGDDPDGTDNACTYHVTVEFTDNRLVDGPGPDLHVVELGAAESVFVSIGVDAEQLRLVGTLEAGSAAIDISPVADPDEEFSVVRLCDGPEVASEVPGTDVDAIAALHSVAS